MRRIDRVGKTLTKAFAVALSFSIMFSQTIGSYADELNTVTELIEEANNDLDTADANVIDAAFDTIEGAGADTVNEKLSSFDNEETINVESGAAISNAEVANNSDIEEEARQAKVDAEAALANAKEGLDASVAAYNDAETAYNTADSLQKDAEAAYIDAEAALNDVSSNTAEAKAALDAAEAKINADEADKAALEKIEDQYYGQILFYFESIANGKKAVYNEDGTLNIEASAEGLTENEINKFAANPVNGDIMFKFGRYLTEELVEYMILHRENVNPESAEFTYGQVKENGAKSVKGQEVKVFTNNEGHDQTVSGNSVTDQNGDTVNPGETKNYWWTSVANNRNGRENHTTVTYTDKDGNEHVEYYNYVFKSSKYGDTLDIENGSIFLAIVEDVDGTWVAKEVIDENNYSNYTDLVNAIAAFEDYTQAKADLEAARARVEALESTLADLTASASAKKTNLETLRNALDTAKEALTLAESKKAEFENTYEEARKAVEGIDLSRFAVVPVAVVAPAAVTPIEETPEEVTVEPEAAPLAAVPVVAVPEDEEADEIEEVAEEVTVGGDEAPLTETPEVNEAPEVKAIEQVAEIIEDTGAIITADIDADFVPLASFPIADSIKNVWWFWILILVTAMTMYIMYKRSTKEEENK